MHHSVLCRSPRIVPPFGVNAGILSGLKIFLKDFVISMFLLSPAPSPIFDGKSFLVRAFGGWRSKTVPF